jgi:hypothetical protein
MNATAKALLSREPLHLRPPFDVYNLSLRVLHSTAPQYDTTLADQLFDNVIRPLLKNHSVGEKRNHWRDLFYCFARADRIAGCVSYSRSSATPKALLNVIDCASKSGLVREHRSPKGSPKQSRLVATPSLGTFLALFHAPHPCPGARVVVRNREDRKAMQFDADHPVAVDAQRKLDVIDHVNNSHEVTFRRWNRWVGLAERRPLRPLHVARFVGGFDLHGRMYGDAFSHQCLPKLERQTIQFGECPSVELDFGGLAPRMLYHLSGLDFRGDPYALWPGMSEVQRELAKRTMNIAINTDSRASALAACAEAARVTTRSGKHKEGKALDTARDFHDAVRTSGFGFGQIYDAAAQLHAPIAHNFGNGRGLVLMRHDSRIALNVLYHFASRGIPCLGVHDSFIVPIHAAHELDAVMDRCYRDEMGGFAPVIKWRQSLCDAQQAA